MTWSTLRIKRALKDRDLTYKDVAELGDVNESVVAKNVRKVEGCKSFPARLAIAKALDADVEDVFGSKKVAQQTLGNASSTRAA